jgi:hypothetical protein
VVHTANGAEDIRSRPNTAVAVTFITTTPRSIDMYITDIHPKRKVELPAYFLGRPAEVYRRHYRRIPSTITPRS